MMSQEYQTEGNEHAHGSSVRSFIHRWLAGMSGKRLHRQSVESTFLFINPPDLTRKSRDIIQSPSE